MAVAASPFSRRSLLRTAAVGAGALTLPALLAACGSGSGAGDGAGTGKGGKTVKLGSNASDEVPKKAYAEAMKAYEGKSGNKVEINTVSHNDFQENINRYLQGNPDDCFTWFAGFRMQFFARKGLLTDVNDLWKDLGGGFSEALKKQSTGEDGKQYFVPYYYYPWAVFYRKSLWKEKGYEVPKTWDAYRALAQRMQKDGLIPIALADKDGWPAMGTFDYINMRLNGYDFHASLMAGKESWTDQRVKTVFDTWRGILPLSQPAPNGRTWQEGMQTLQQKKAGMIVHGMQHPSAVFKADELADVDFFAFPEIDSKHAQDAVEAPIDGFLIPKKSKNVDAAKDLLKYLATPEAQLIYVKADPGNVVTHSKADTASYSPMQNKAVELVSKAKQISQFMDRDTRPDFASTVMIKAIQDFLNNPNDVAGLTKKIEDQKKTIFAND